MVGAIMNSGDSAVYRRALTTASAFGSLIRKRRKSLKMRQAQLALVTGVGRRLVIDLEAGKPSCQLGRSLLVAEALGLQLTDLLAMNSTAPSGLIAELPDLQEDIEEPNGHSARLL
jgi:transcriptional regulator with XRE-family HTH domain